MSFAPVVVRDDADLVEVAHQWQDELVVERLAHLVLRLEQDAEPVVDFSNSLRDTSQICCHAWREAPSPAWRRTTSWCATLLISSSSKTFFASR